MKCELNVSRVSNLDPAQLLLQGDEMDKIKRIDRVKFTKYRPYQSFCAVFMNVKFITNA